MTMPTIRTLSRDGTLKRTDVGLFCRLEDLHELPGFNIIRDYESPKYQADVDALVAYLEAGGTVDALEVRPRAEGGLWIVQGHTRRFAYKKMDERGTLVRDPKGDAWIQIVPFVGNDADQILRQATSVKRAEVDVLGIGRVYNKLLAMHWTVQQIAERSGEQVATIKRVLDLANGNTDVHEQVKAGTVSPTIAAAAVRKHGDKAGEVLATQLAEAKKLGKKKVTAAVTKLTFDQWFEGWYTQGGCASNQREGYKAMFQLVWTAARAGK